MSLKSHFGEMDKEGIKMASNSLQTNNISLRMSDKDVKMLDKLCDYYDKRRSDVIRGTIIARYKALVKKGEING